MEYQYVFYVNKYFTLLFSCDLFYDFYKITSRIMEETMNKVQKLISIDIWSCEIKSRFFAINFTINNYFR